MNIKMTSSLIRMAALALFLPMQASLAADESKTINWPSFRGPAASGVAEGFRTALKWDAESGKGIKWKTEIPGLGLSSPIIWEDQVFLTTAVRKEGDQPLKVGLYGDIKPVEDDSQYSWHVICLNKKTGKIEWDEVACEGVPKIKRHTKASHANSTPATDGKHVVAMFGSEGLYCYDMKGKLLWKKDFGVLDSGYYVVKDAQWGFGSSPIIHDGYVILQCDVQEGSFITALNVKTGEEVWKTPRDEVPTWSSPAIFQTTGGLQVVCNGYKHIGGYEFSTGKEIWKLAGGGDIPVPTPVIGHDLVYITNAHGMMAPIYAIKPSAEGQIKLQSSEDTHKDVAWWGPRMGNYMQTPLIYGDYLYSCLDNGVLTCYDAKTGEKVYRKRVGKGLAGFTASAVAADKKIYYTCEDGDIYVVRAGKNFKLYRKCSLGEPCMATPAISDGILFIRGEKHLFAIERAPKSSSKASNAKGK